MASLHLTEALISLITTTALLLGSPGPATLGLAGVGAAFGFRGGLNFLGGILVGLCVVIVGTSFGMAAFFKAFPGTRFTVQIIGAVYICYIALKIASASDVVEGGAAPDHRPKFMDGFILNLMNPKAYAVFIALFSQFLLPLALGTSALILTALICFLVAVIVDTLWLSFGVLIRPLFQRPRQAKVVRIILAILMVVSVLWAFTQ